VYYVDGSGEVMEVFKNGELRVKANDGTEFTCTPEPTNMWTCDPRALAALTASQKPNAVFVVEPKAKGERAGVLVGEVEESNPETQVCLVKLFQCTKDARTPECASGRWWKPKNKCAELEFTQWLCNCTLTKSELLNKAARDSIEQFFRSKSTCTHVASTHARINTLSSAQLS
jgi:hypothetical protein